MKNNEIEKDGMRFVGWYLDPLYRKRVNPGGILPFVMTFYDKWIPILYPVTYDCHGGVNSRKNPRKVSLGTEEQVLHPAHKNEMVFCHWLLDGEVVDVLPGHVGHPLHLEAVFKEYPLVSFDSVGGGKVKPKSVNDAGHIAEFRPPMRIGCTFAGWYLDSEYQQPFYFDLPIVDDITLYAKWKMVHYKIVYDLQGGFMVKPNPETYTYFHKTLMLAPAMKKGCEFLGWFDPRGNRVFEIPHHSLGDWYLVARFQPL